MTESRRILVTGATGIAGQHIADALARRSFQVLRVARRPPPDGYAADISDPAAIRRLPEFEGVVHCAGLTPRLGTTTWDDFQRSNVVGSVQLADEAAKRGASFFVY